MYPIRLTGIRTVLREFRPSDVDDVHAVVGDDRVASWMAFDTKTREQSETMVQGCITLSTELRRSEYYLVVCRPSDDTAIGFVRLGLAGVAAAKLGYAIGADHWGSGYASDAAASALRFGFEQLLLHRVSAAIGPANKASMGVAQRLGMSYEGRIRHHVVSNGEWRDSLLYSILADEWARQQQAPDALSVEGDLQRDAAG